MSHNTDIMPIGEAADFLGVPQAQLRRWALQGIGPKFEGHALHPDRMQYSYDDLLAARSILMAPL